jgi:hypothetical protein
MSSDVPLSRVKHCFFHALGEPLRQTYVDFEWTFPSPSCAGLIRVLLDCSDENPAASVFDAAHPRSLRRVVIHHVEQVVEILDEVRRLRNTPSKRRPSDG